jgi:CheY-like chemotaxis protein
MRDNPNAADVLIVEDDKTTRRCLRRLLEGAGYRCAEAADGREALGCAFATPPRLVLLDIMMPQLDGLAVARRLREDPRTRGVPLLCMTGWDDPAARLRAARAGCAAFVSKPVDLAALLDLVDATLPLGARLAARPGGPLAEAPEAAATPLEALRAMQPRWLRQCACWLREHVAPAHPDLPLLERLAGHLWHAGGVGEAALAEADRRAAARHGPDDQRKGPHAFRFHGGLPDGHQAPQRRRGDRASRAGR